MQDAFAELNPALCAANMHQSQPLLPAQWVIVMLGHSGDTHHHGAAFHAIVSEPETLRSPVHTSQRPGGNRHGPQMGYFGSLGVRGTCTLKAEKTCAPARPEAEEKMGEK